MRVPDSRLIIASVLLSCVTAICGQPKSDPFAAVPEGERKDLATRLNEYVRAYKFKGVAVVHAVRQQGTWVFSGWSFAEFPNKACGTLSEPGWKAPADMEWQQPIEEFRGVHR
jgi:hypothetical protein